MVALLHILLISHALASKEGRRSFLLRYSVVYRNRKSCKLRGQSVEDRTKRELWKAMHDETNIWNVDTFFRPTTVNTTANKRKPLKLVNTWQLRRGILEMAK